MFSMSLYTKACDSVLTLQSVKYFSHCCDKVSDQSTLKEDLQSIMAGKTWLQYMVTSHILSADRKLRDE